MYQEESLSIKEYKNIFSSYTLLYAEDEEGMRHEIGEILRRLFRNVWIASDGKEALTLYYHHKPSILLCDITMPKMNGLELVQHIRLYDTQTRIVLLTGHSDTEYLLSAVELGLTRYLVKPIISHELLKALRKATDEMKQQCRTDEIIFSEHCSYNPLSYEFCYHGIITKFSKKEHELFELFLTSSHLTNEMIAQELWSHEAPSLESIRSLVRYLRRKLPCDCIKTLVGNGYIFDRNFLHNLNN